MIVSVGATGFEPATSCSRSRRSTGLSYAPKLHESLSRHDPSHAPERTRTSNLLIRSQMLYPIELRARALANTAGLRVLGEHRKITRTEPKRYLPSCVNHGSYKTRTCDLHDVNVAL